MKDDAFDPGPPPSIDLAVSLGPEQIEQFQRDGFTSVERITTDDELDWLEPIYDELVGSRGGTRTRRIGTKRSSIEPSAAGSRWIRRRPTAGA